MPRRCVIVGDVMMDVTARIDSPIAFASDTPARISLQPGGAAANTAAWMAVLGHPVSLVGAIGDDGFGQTLQAELLALGVDARLNVVPGRSTGTCVVVVDGQHERTMFPDSGANGGLLASLARDLDLGEPDHVHLSGYALLNPESRAAALEILGWARSNGVSVSLDPASAAPIRRDPTLFTRLLPGLDVVLANADEAAALTGGAEPREAAERLATWSSVAVVKRGGQGVIASAAGHTFSVPALPAVVVDTTGAGDAFAAGFLTAWLAGGGIREALDSGQRVAVQAVGRVGASPLAG